MKRSIEGSLTNLLYCIINSNFGLIEKGKAEPSHKLPTLYQVLNGTYRRRNGERSLTMKNTQFEAINQCQRVRAPVASTNVSLIIYYLDIILFL